TLSKADLTLLDPQAAEADLRPLCQAKPVTNPPAQQGNPLSVVTDNVFLDQRDADLPALVNLSLERSYNSRNSEQGVEEGFARGWTHTYSKTLRWFKEPRSVYFRDPNGVISYYEDKDGDARFEQVVPFSQASFVVREPSGVFTRRFRAGGFESYDTTGRLVREVDASGNAVELNWSDGGLTVTDEASGRSLRLPYVPGTRRFGQLEGPDGVIATYAYDYFQLTKVTYADGSGYEFSYDSGRLSQVKDLSGRVVERHAYTTGPDDPVLTS